MKQIHSQQSLLDFLTDVMPDFRNLTIMVSGDPTSDPKAKDLFNLWSDCESKISSRKFRRPPSMSQSTVDGLEKSKFIEVQGNSIKITDKGAETIKKIILHSEDSTFNKTADKVKTASVNNSNKNSWYARAKR